MYWIIVVTNDLNPGPKIAGVTNDLNPGPEIAGVTNNSMQGPKELSDRDVSDSEHDQDCTAETSEDIYCNGKCSLVIANIINHFFKQW